MPQPDISTGSESREVALLCSAAVLLLHTLENLCKHKKNCHTTKGHSPCSPEQTKIISVENGGMCFSPRSVVHACLCLMFTVQRHTFPLALYFTLLAAHHCVTFCFKCYSNELVSMFSWTWTVESVQPLCWGFKDPQSHSRECTSRPQPDQSQRCGWAHMQTPGLRGSVWGQTTHDRRQQHLCHWLRLWRPREAQLHRGQAWHLLKCDGDILWWVHTPPQHRNGTWLGLYAPLKHPCRWRRK